jgi:hypothetical protein
MSGLLTFDAIVVIALTYGLLLGWASSLASVLLGFLMMRRGRPKAGALACVGALAPIIHLFMWAVLGEALFGGVSTTELSVWILVIVSVALIYLPLAAAYLAFRPLRRTSV